MSTPNTIIEVTELSKIYRENFRSIHALKNIHLNIRQNRVVGILGPNGAGKTTLLKIITGIIPTGRYTGTVRLFQTADTSIVKHRIGFLPEHPEFFKHITPRELLEFSLKISNQWNKSNSGNVIDTMLKRVNLFQEKDKKINQFSKGMRQRIGIAQAIIHSPDLLVLDEPMSGLDPNGRRMVIDLIQSYYKEGKTILFSTHDLDDIDALCTDVLVLVKGEILLEKSLSELREKCSYKIEWEKGDEKQSIKVENEAALWDFMEDARTQGKRIIRVQSGIAEQLEQYYGDLS